VAILAAGATLLAACSSSGSSGNSSHGATTTTTAAGSAGGGAGKSGGTLTIAVSSDQGTEDPQEAGSNDTIFSARQIVDSLTDQDPKTGKIVPWLASSWDVSSNATTYTFHLRTDVTFSDGTALTAQVVKDNFDAIPKLGATAQLAAGYLTGATTTVVDAHTVKVSFPQPNASFLQATATHSLGILADSSAKASVAQRAKGVIGSGPFVLQKYVPNQEVDLVKRTGYKWGSSVFTKSGEAYLDKIVYKIVPEAGVRTGSLESGQVDAIGNVGLADEKALKAAGVNLISRANPGVVFNIGINNSRPLFQDKSVREAISLAIDRASIVSSQLPSGSQPATSILSHTTPDYENLSSDLTYDQAKAKSLLASAGWTAGSGGILTKNGTKLSFTIDWFANFGPSPAVLQLIQQELKAVGIDVQLKEVQIAQLVQIQQSGDFDALWGNLTRADPDILRSTYSTQGLNAYKVKDSTLDGLLIKQAATADASARQKLVDQAQESIVSNYYAIPVFELETEFGVAKRVHDFNFEASSRIQLHDTWVDQ